jgi:hypothetical protein
MSPLNTSPALAPGTERGVANRPPPSQIGHLGERRRSGRLVTAATTSATTAARVPAARGSLASEAVRAVDGLFATRLEWYLGVLATLGAHSREHLPLSALVSTPGGIATGGIAPSAATPVRLVSSPALWTPARLVGEALLCEELLLPRCEHELAVAVAAGKGLVFHADYADSFNSFLLGTIRQRDCARGERLNERTTDPDALAN